MVTTTTSAATLSEPRRALPGALGCPLGLSARTAPSASRQAGASRSPARRAADAAPGAAPAPSLGGAGPGRPGPAAAGARRQGGRHAYADVSTGGPVSVADRRTSGDGPTLGTVVGPSVRPSGTKPQHEARRADPRAALPRAGRQPRGWGRGMCPVPSTVHREPICCECQAKFGGCLPVPRVKAALPYWVPLSLRPRKQIQKMVRFHIPKTSEACPCPCHRFGGRLPMPRDQAVMPYWVPQVLRPHKKVVKRQQSCKGIQEPALDLRSWYNRWRICCDGRLLLKWQQLQALHQHEPLAPGRGVSPPAPLLPFSLLTLLQAVLRVVVAIRQCSVVVLLLWMRVRLWRMRPINVIHETPEWRLTEW
ncbi:hypothetical protein GH733_012866 [Mirounga leonina]|nr:hypothetical protein GH733_012866 [Mirounga leonina]